MCATELREMFDRRQPSQGRGRASPVHADASDLVIELVKLPGTRDLRRSHSAQEKALVGAGVMRMQQQLADASAEAGFLAGGGRERKRQLNARGAWGGLDRVDEGIRVLHGRKRADRLRLVVHDPRG